MSSNNSRQRAGPHPTYEVTFQLQTNVSPKDLGDWIVAALADLEDDINQESLGKEEAHYIERTIGIADVPEDKSYEGEWLSGY